MAHAGSCDRLLVKPCLPDVPVLTIRDVATAASVAAGTVREDDRVSPYEQAFNRIRAEYTEMPGMQLTPEQVGRLSGVGSSVCRLVLDDLVRARFLTTGANGTYWRSRDIDRVTAR